MCFVSLIPMVVHTTIIAGLFPPCFARWNTDILLIAGQCPHPGTIIKIYCLKYTNNKTLLQKNHHESAMFDTDDL